MASQASMSVPMSTTERAGIAEGGETVGGSAGGELGPGGRSAEMISNGCPDANGKVLRQEPWREPAANDPRQGAWAAGPSDSGARKSKPPLQGPTGWSTAP
jgi:hypothetical protein